jgi:hypothetical protein
MERFFYAGSYGPYLYDDTDTYDDGETFQGLYTDGEITVGDLTIKGLTGGRFVGTDINKKLVSFTNFVWNDSGKQLQVKSGAAALSATDTFQMYGADASGAGTAAAHFISEDSKIVRLYPESHIVDASVAHSITDPADTPADADVLRDDLVLNTIPSIETALNNLGIKVNAILTAIETIGLLKTS